MPMPGKPRSMLILDERPTPPPQFMIAGFEQWADAGNVSSGIPRYLAESCHARHIGRLERGNCYLFQLPGRQGQFRPPVEYRDGIEVSYQADPDNEFFYAPEGSGLVLFTGTEPLQREEQYAAALLDGAAELGVRRIVIAEGVGNAVPFNKQRKVTASYSMPHLRYELEKLAVSFSDYKGAATIGMVLAHYAQKRGQELVRLTVFVPYYPQIGLGIREDWQAYADVLRRVQYLADIRFELADIERRGTEIMNEIKRYIDQTAIANPQVKDLMKTIEEQFDGVPFVEPTLLTGLLAQDIEQALRNAEKQ